MGRRRRSGGKAGGAARRESLPANEVDEFMEARDLVRVGGNAGSDSESASEDERALDPSRGSSNVLDLGVSSDEEGSGDESSSGSEDGRGQAARMIEEDEEEGFRARRQRAIEEEEAMGKQWGKSKGAYYDADTVEYEIESDEDVAKDEEAEALRLQRERAEQMDDEDFGEAGMLGSILAAKDKKRSKGGKDTKKKSKKGKKSSKREQSSDEEEEEEEDEGFSLGGRKRAEVEKVARDLSSLSKDDKLQVVLSDSPELLGLLEDLRSRLGELREHVAPLMERVRERKLDTSDGISFLEMKYHVLLNYCVNIVFYLYLKSEGKRVQDHPVVRQLVYYRTVLEKIRPLDQKLKYQVDKLLQSAAVAADGGAGGNAQAPRAGGADPLSFRPNPSALVAKDGSSAAAAAAAARGDDEDEDEAGAASGRALARARGDDDDGDVYRPPRLAAVPYMDEKERKRKRREEKKRKKLAGSAIVRELRSELSERPVETTALGLADSRPDEDLEAQRQFEEENFMRLAETKKSKKKRTRGVSAGIFDDLEDFGDFGHVSGAREDEAFGLGELRAARAAAEAEAAAASSSGGRKRKASRGGRGAGGAGEVDLDEEALYGEEAERASELYDHMESSRRKKRRAREEKYAAPENLLAEHDPHMLDEEGARREVGRDIMKNRGLTRYRPKEKSNPKTRNRLRYEKAVTKRKSQVREFKGTEHQYGGDRTGIKSNLVRSTSLKN